MFADIIVDLSVESLDRTFQYRIPAQWEDGVQIGSRVVIPFGKGNRRMSGYIMNLTEIPAWPVEKMKDILGVEEKDIPVEGQLLSLAAWIRQKYGTTMNEALKTVLPVRKQIKSVEEHWLNFVVPQDVVQKELDRCRLRHYKAMARLLQGMLAEDGQMTTRLAAKKYGITKPVIDGMVKAGLISVTNEKRYRNPLSVPQKEDSKKASG